MCEVEEFRPRVPSTTKQRGATRGPVNQTNPSNASALPHALAYRNRRAFDPILVRGIRSKISPIRYLPTCSPHLPTRTCLLPSRSAYQAAYRSHTILSLRVRSVGSQTVRLHSTMSSHKTKILTVAVETRCDPGTLIYLDRGNTQHFFGLVRVPFGVSCLCRVSSLILEKRFHR